MARRTHCNYSTYSTFHFQFAWCSVSHKASRLWLTRVAGATETFIIHKAQRWQRGRATAWGMPQPAAAAIQSNRERVSKRGRGGERELALCFNGLISGPVVKPTFEYWPGLKWNVRGVAKQCVICTPYTHTHSHICSAYTCPLCSSSRWCLSNEALSLRHHQQNPDETRFLFDFTFFLWQLRGRPGAVVRGGW